jgi:hypothetical protein
MTLFSRATTLAAGLVFLSACSTEQRGKIDSAAGAAESSARAALAVINIDLGRHVDAEKKVTDDTETFAPSDTIYASVHTSGTVEQGSSVVGRWTFPDASVINQNASEAATSQDRLVFFITKAGGLPKGNYTFQILVNDREVRSKAARVQGT